MGGYMESEERAAARWELMQRHAEERAKAKQEAEQSAQLSNIQNNA